MSVARSAFSSLISVAIACVSFVAGLIAGVCAWMGAAGLVEGDLAQQMSDAGALVTGLITMLVVALIVAALLNRFRTFIAAGNVQK